MAGDGRWSQRIGGYAVVDEAFRAQDAWHKRVASNKIIIAGQPERADDMEKNPLTSNIPYTTIEVPAGRPLDDDLGVTVIGGLCV